MVAGSARARCGDRDDPEGRTARLVGVASPEQAGGAGVTTTGRPRPVDLTALAVTVARLVLGGVWIAAGAAKVTDLDASVRAVRAYRLLPETVAQVVGAGLPMVEILLGVLLIVGAGVRVSAVVSAVLMSAFVVGIASAWARGLRIDCGCFGSGGELAAGEDPTYGLELARDAGLLLLSLLVAARPPGRLAIDGWLAAQKENL
jgi:uncharacterized membrane protein YphA (DoxX/SURF4 family)